MPKKLSDLYADLKSTIVGTRTQKIDAKLDQAVKDIVAYKSNSGRAGYIELVKAVISKSTNGLQIGAGSGGMFAQGAAGPAAFGQGQRIARYQMYQAIIDNINYCYRALSVLTDNILSPDDITKVSLEVRPKTYLEDETPTGSKAKLVSEVIKLIELEKKLERVVSNTLLYGDYFCEIGDSVTALTSRSILTESQTYRTKLKEQLDTGLREKHSFTEKTTTFGYEINYSALDEKTVDPKKDQYENIEDDDKGDKKRREVLRNLKLIYHDAKNVIKLQSALYPLCFGFLIFPDVRGMGVANISIADDTINQICFSILRSLENKIPQMKEYQDNKELKDVIKKMIQHADPNKAFEIRYIPPDKMTHFKRPSSKYDPYGESIFDSSQYSAKVLIALETALAIARLSRSTEKRKIAIEIGLPRDAKKAIEAMKEEFRKRKVSLDSFGTVDTIPSMITTFEDIYIPQKDGKPFVDVSTFTEGNIDVRSKVDELKFMRDQLVASLGIPPAFIGIEENLSNKAALSEENILFARTVIGHQKYLTEQIQDLIQKVFDIIDPETALTILDNVDVSLPAPKSLQYEREARYMNEITGLIESLDRIGIPKEYAKKKYLAHFDWEEIQKYDIDEKVQKAVDPTKAEDDTGLGGMGGADMGGF